MMMIGKYDDMAPVMTYVILLFTISTRFTRAINPRDPDAVGRAVAEETYQEIAPVFPGDHRFLFNLMAAESLFGHAYWTYPPKYHGGMCQVDEVAFDRTQDSNFYPDVLKVQTMVSRVEKHFNIIWQQLKWIQLRRPFYSCLVARMGVYMLEVEGEYSRRKRRSVDLTPTNVSKVIPATVELQAVFWAETYHNGTDRSPETFVRRVRASNAFTDCCNGVNVSQIVDNQLKAGNVFSSDHHFLRRIALVETKFGMESCNMYNVSEAMLLCTQDEASFQTRNGLELYSGEPVLESIKANYSLDWSQVTTQDLRIPMFSGLAARLFLATSAVPIPDTLPQQAVHWVTYYNTNGTVEQFVHIVKAHGDPHVTQLVAGSDTMLSYDLLGTVGDVYSFHNEPFLGLQSWVKLSELSDKKKGLFIGELTVTRGVVSVVVRPRKVTLGDTSHNWIEMKNSSIDGGDVEVNFEKRRLTVDVLGVVRITVTRPYNKFLNLAIQMVGPYSDKAHGIIGDVFRNVNIVDWGNGRGELHLANSNGAYVDLIKRHGCWNIKSNHKSLAFQQLLARNLMECHAC